MVAPLVVPLIVEAACLTVLEACLAVFLPPRVMRSLLPFCKQQEQQSCVLDGQTLYCQVNSSQLKQPVRSHLHSRRPILEGLAEKFLL